MANWISSLIVAQTFLTLTEALGTAYTFLLFGIFATIGLVFTYIFVPETKGLAFEEVEKMLEMSTWKAGIDCSSNAKSGH